MSTILRVGAVGYMNTKPLIEGLEVFLPGCRLTLDIPSRLADSMKSGEVDVGLIPVAEFFRAGNYGMVPGIGITSCGPVGSVFLLAKNGMERITTLAMDEGSRTSASLARILLHKNLGLLPKIQPFPMGQASVPEDVDGLLLIGDRAMKTPPPGFKEQSDLGAWWTRETGLPFVYAVWAVRPGLVLSPNENAAFHKALNLGRSRMAEIARRESSVYGLPVSRVLHYLTEQIGFEVGEKELQGMHLYGEMLAEFENMLIGN